MGMFGSRGGLRFVVPTRAGTADAGDDAPRLQQTAEIVSAEKAQEPFVDLRLRTPAAQVEELSKPHFPTPNS